MSNLSVRETEVLTLIAGGKSTKQVADELGISFKTAVCHRYHIFKKLGVRNTVQLILQSARLGLIELSPASPELLEPLHSMQIPAEKWRQVLNDAYLRVMVGRRHATEAHQAFSGNGGSDGTHTYLRALREEARALAEYMKVVSLYTDFLHKGHGKRGR